MNSLENINPFFILWRTGAKKWMKSEIVSRKVNKHTSFRTYILPITLGLWMQEKSTQEYTFLRIDSHFSHSWDALQMKWENNFRGAATKLLSRCPYLYRSILLWHLYLLVYRIYYGCVSTKIHCQDPKVKKRRRRKIQSLETRKCT